MLAKRMSGCILMCLLVLNAMPLYAQKKWVPAAKAALEKNVIPMHPLARSGEMAVRAVVPPAGGKAARLPDGFSQHLQQSLFAPSPAYQARKIPRQFASDQEMAAEEQRIRHFLMSLGFSEPFYWGPATLSPKDEKSFAATYLHIQQFAKHPLLRDIPLPTLRPMLAYTSFAKKNNEMVLKGQQHLLQKIKWLKKWPNQGRNELTTLSSGNVISELAKRLSREKMVFVGEQHYDDDVQYAVGKLVLELKAKNPGRRVVVFTEFLDLYPEKENLYFRPESSQSWETYYRPAEKNMQRVAKLPGGEVEYGTEVFKKWLRRTVELYPLEDAAQIEMLEYTTFGDFANLLSVAMRNKFWARVIDTKMKEVRKENPDALFIVYAGAGHMSWVEPHSLPKFFANENPVVVEITSQVPPVKSTLYEVWGKEDPFFAKRSRSTLAYWQGPNARLLGKQTGFDYNLILPYSWKTRLKDWYDKISPFD